MDYIWFNEHSIIITICLGLILCFLNYLLAPKNIILTGVIIISTAMVYVFYMFIVSFQVESSFVNNTLFIFNVTLLWKIADSKIIYNLFFKIKYEQKVIEYLENKYYEELEDKEFYKQLQQNENKIAYFKLFEDKEHNVMQCPFEVHRIKKTIEEIKKSENITSEEEVQQSGNIVSNKEGK